MVLIVPGQLDLLRPNGEDNPELERVVERSEIFKLVGWWPQDRHSVAEAAIVGLSPETVHAAQGALVVSALRLDPPVRSAHFAISLGTLADGAVKRLEIHDAPDQQEERTLKQVFQKLDTDKFRTFWGEGLEHAAVWLEGSVDMSCLPLDHDWALELSSSMPQGDGEAMLRRYVDDSINLLMDADMNKKRQDEARPGLNVLWPWGQGFQPNLPHLGLLRGTPSRVESRSLRLAGLARLVGYKPGDFRDFGRPLATNWARLRHLAASSSLPLVANANEIETATRAHRHEEGWSLWMDTVNDFVLPLARNRETLIVVCAPSRAGSLALVFDPEKSLSSNKPFDARVLDDKSVQTVHGPSFVAKHLTLG